jgi:hypothetical protein
MKSKLRMASFWLVLGTVCLGLAQGLWAESPSVGCGYFQGQKAGQKAAPSLKPASLQLLSNHDSSSASIVGFWNFTFVSEGNPGIPDGTVIDAGYVAWHSDGTEFTNSGSRPPMTGNFCMGVWKQTKHSTFKLNHFGLSWDPTGTVFIGPANIRSEVTVDRGKQSYSGTFTIDQYDTNGNLLAHIAGNVTAQRITAD